MSPVPLALRRSLNWCKTMMSKAKFNKSKSAKFMKYILNFRPFNQNIRPLQTKTISASKNITQGKNYIVCELSQVRLILLGTFPINNFSCVSEECSRCCHRFLTNYNKAFICVFSKKALPLFDNALPFWVNIAKLNVSQFRVSSWEP